MAGAGQGGGELELRQAGPRCRLDRADRIARVCNGPSPACPARLAQFEWPTGAAGRTMAR